MTRTKGENMDNFADKRDHLLLDKDRYTFSVMDKIIEEECRIIFSDHKQIIMCQTDIQYPVWIWTPDDASEEIMDKAYRLAQENSLTGRCSFNIKYPLAEYFIARAAKKGVTLSVLMNLYTYDCAECIPPHVSAEGSIHLCTEQDTDKAAEFIQMFNEETGDRTDYDNCCDHAKNMIADNKFFFWLDGSSRPVACCASIKSEAVTRINCVYTLKEYRRKHFSENLVYRVTKAALDEGSLPMLYTDADYAASNACYEKIGFTLKGKLCTIG